MNYSKVVTHDLWPSVATDDLWSLQVPKDLHWRQPDLRFDHHTSRSITNDRSLTLLICQMPKTPTEKTHKIRCLYSTLLARPICETCFGDTHGLMSYRFSQKAGNTCICATSQHNARTWHWQYLHSTDCQTTRAHTHSVAAVSTHYTSTINYQTFIALYWCLINSLYARNNIFNNT